MVVCKLVCMVVPMLSQASSGIGSMGKDKGEGKRWVVKGEAKAKGGTAMGQGEGDICNACIGP